MPQGALEDLSLKLASVGQRFYQRGWVLGTSGNFSAVVSANPFRLAITPSAANKGRLTGAEILVIDERARVIGHRHGRPSAETALHLEIIRLRGAHAVLHTHSVWGTILSDLHAGTRGLTIEGYEMLKGLAGVATHDHRELVPIVENDQNMDRLALDVRTRLGEHTAAHAFLIRGHGLYTWGTTIDEAERHVEILEFLFEAIGRRSQHGDRHHP